MNMNEVLTDSPVSSAYVNMSDTRTYLWLHDCLPQYEKKNLLGNCH